MSNLANARARQRFPLGLRESVIASFPDRYDTLPARPVGIDLLLGTPGPLGNDGGFASARTRAVIAVRDALYAAPGRERDAALIWSEALATMLYATELARAVGLEPEAVACAALLHRAGDACVLRAIALTEADALLRIDEPSRADLCARFQREFTLRIAAAWQLPDATAAVMQGWRHYGQVEVFSRPAAIVYFAHLLAVELLRPEFCAPGLVQAVAREMNLERAHVDSMRAHDGMIRSVVEVFGLPA